MMQDTNSVEEINTNEKAYVLGLVYNDENFQDVEKVSDHVHDSIKSCVLQDKFKQQTSFPHLSTRDLEHSFIRGYFDANGAIYHVCEPSAQPYCEIVVEKEKESIVKEIASLCSFPHNISSQTAKDIRLRYDGVNCLDFLHSIYQVPLNNDILSHVHTRKHRQYIRMCVGGDGTFCLNENMYRLPVCKVRKTHMNAILPSKLRASDAGYDLTVIQESKKWLHDITLYDTGIQICMDRGYYAEIVPRSSLSKSGYMLANSVGVIDENYRGNIYVALIKVDPDASPIELPFRCCQILFKRQLHMDIVEVDREEELNHTVRQNGGFGSTG